MKPNDLEVTSVSAISHILEHCPERVRWFEKPPTVSSRVSKLVALATQKKVEIRPGNTAMIRMLPFEFAGWDFIETVALSPRALVLVLDHLQDPQNLGAIIRSAEAFGVCAVVLPRVRSVGITNAVYTASAGAVETVPLVGVANLNDRLVRLKQMNFWVVGTCLGERVESPWAIPTFDKIALVVGAEFEGLSHLIEKSCDWLCQIPMRGKIESLNVSAATAVLLYELSVRRSALA